MEYEIIVGRKCPIVYRTWSTDDISCPYCFKKHVHGTADGHRITHCSTGSKKHKVIVGDDEVDFNNGYVIKTINSSF